MTEPAAPSVPRAARVMGAAGRTLITAGIVVLLFVAFQLWGTNIQEARAQDDLRGEFDRVTAAQELVDALRTPTTTGPEVIDAGGNPGEPVALPAPAPRVAGGLDPEVLALFFPEDGDAVARIEIPSIDVDKIVVNGVQVADLRKGPGLYPGTAPTGTAGNTAVAGHRTTYGAPFNRIDELAPGDEIHVTGVLGRFTYRVMDPADAFPTRLDAVDSLGAGHIIVRPGATWVLGDFGDDRLTLTACHPKLSSRQRIIVAAELVTETAERPEFADEVVAAFLAGDPDPGAALPGEGLPSEFDAPTPAATPTLDEGLDGERDAIPPAIAWLLAATLFWVGAGMLGQGWFADRRRRIVVRLLGLVPAGFCLWYAFELIDRALPAA